jgi:hypothetical protein
VLAALTLRKGNDFKMPIVSRSQRGLKSSPVIQRYFSNSKIPSIFSSNYQEALRTLSFIDYIDAYLLNRLIFGNGRKKDV